MCVPGARPPPPAGPCGLECLPPGLAALSCLASLSLSGNTPLSCYTPLASLGRSLARLDLSDCGLEALPPELSVLSCLEFLELSDNPGLGEADDTVFVPLLGATRLTALELRACELQAVPRVLAALRALCALALSGNEWIGHDLGGR